MAPSRSPFPPPGHLTGSSPGMMLCRLGVMVEEHMDRKQTAALRDAKTAKREGKKNKQAPPDSASWLRPLSDYKRREAKAFAVTRFG
jgi:hypothetical protein